MAVNKEKKNVLTLTMDKDLHLIVKECAEKEHRKVSNFIVNATIEYLREKYKIEI